MKRLLLVLAALLFTVQIHAAEGTGEQKRLISLDFPETSLSTVLDVLSIKTGRKFITDSELARKKIVLSLREVTPEEALNALLDTYNLYYVRQGDTNIYVIKSKNDATVTTVSRVIFLNYAVAKDLVEVLSKNVSKNGHITADTRTNTLLVTDAGDSIDKLEALVKTLDIPPMQVLLEAKIIDVKIDGGLKIGANLGISKTDGYWIDPLELAKDEYLRYDSDSDYSIPETAFHLKGTNFSTGFLPLSGGGQFSLGVIRDDNILTGTLEALKTDSNAKLLTNPRLLVVNNQEATIDIVEEVPYVQSSELTTGSSVIRYSISFKDIGIKLKVKPQINRDGSIVLNIAPEQSFRTGETISNVPVVYTSKTNTTFMLRNGETAVIGGLIKESNTDSEYKIPLLGDIPIIGYLFKRYSKDKTRTELTIFITAKVVQ